MHAVATTVGYMIICEFAPFTPVRDAARYGFLTEEHASRPVHRGLSTPIFFALTTLTRKLLRGIPNGEPMKHEVSVLSFLKSMAHTDAWCSLLVLKKGNF